MKGGTMFSGIGAPECAAPWVDWRWCAEIEPFPAAVHAARFPGTPNLGDVLAPDFLARAAMMPTPDILVGGPPCQAFSIAGLRRGLGDDRGNLTMRWVRIIHAIQPRYAVTENVPGWLSTKDNAFGCFLAGLVGADAPLVPPRECGRRWTDAGVVVGPVRDAAWRILDAQHFGVAQRRRRVFVVSRRAGSGECADALLPLTKSLSGHPPARGEAREDVAAPLAAGTRSNGGYRNDADAAENLIADTVRSHPRAGSNSVGLLAFDTTQITSPTNGSNPRPGGPCHPLAAGAHAPALARCVTTGEGKRLDGESCNFVAHSLRADGFDASEDGIGRGTPLVPVAFRVTPNDGAYETGDRVGSLTTATDKSAHSIVSASIIRRLMPLECERLQGFPDGWTGIVYRGKPAADGPRYKAIGNSMAVPVLAWLLDRIRQVDAIQMARAA